MPSCGGRYRLISKKRCLGEVERARELIWLLFLTGAPISVQAVNGPARTHANLAHSKDRQKVHN